MINMSTTQHLNIAIWESVCHIITIDYVIIPTNDVKNTVFIFNNKYSFDSQATSVCK